MFEPGQVWRIGSRVPRSQGLRQDLNNNFVSKAVCSEDPQGSRGVNAAVRLLSSARRVLASSAGMHQMRQ